MQMVPFHILPFRFRLEMLKQAFVTCHKTELKIIAFVSISLQQF